MHLKWKSIATSSLLSAILFTSLPAVLSAQDLSWVKTAGSTALDQGFGVDVDLAGNVYAIGSFNDEIVFESGNASARHTSAGAFDNYIAKYSVDGDFLWSKHFGGAGTDRIYELVIDEDGDLLVTGSFEESVVFGLGESNETTLSSLGSQDIFIARYDSEGQLAWVKQAGGSSDDAAFSLYTDSDSNIYIAGTFRFRASFGVGENNEIELMTQGVEDLFLAKYNSDGLLTWVRGAGGSASDFGNGIAVDDAGNVLVTGAFSGRATFAEGESNELVLDSGTSLSNLFIAKYDLDGVLQWAKRAGATSGGNSSATNANSFEVDALGNSYITGSFGESATFGEGEANEVSFTSAGSIDIFIAKYDPDGSVLWVKHPEGVGHDVGRSLELDGSDSFYLIGDFAEPLVLAPGESNQTELSDIGAFLAKYDSTGLLLWARLVGSSSDGVVVFDNAIDASLDNMHITGAYWGDISFGAGESNQTDFTSLGRSDIFVAKYSTEVTTGIEAPGRSAKDFGLLQNYPNPFSQSTVISFESPTDEEASLSIYNLQGQVVRRLALSDSSAGQRSINWDGKDDSGARLAPGVYLLKLNTGELSDSKALILQR